MNEGVDRFASFLELEAAHDVLLDRREQLADPDRGAPDFWEEVSAFIRRAEATGALLDISRDRRAGQSILDYWTSALHRARGDVSEARLAAFDPVLAPELPDEPCPYQGLAAFGERDYEFFFGRDRLTGEMLERLRQGQQLLFVVGASGSGKSSAVQAGLLPALKSGALPGSETWRTVLLTPGAQPLANLRRAILLAADDSSWSDSSLVASSTGTVEGEYSEFFSPLERGGEGIPTVLVIDQFEELFTLCAAVEERLAFVERLIWLVQSSVVPHMVVLTMRTDFVDNVAKLPELFSLFRTARVDVEALDINELRAAIERPATKVGLRFEEGIIDDLISTILGERAGLPLLQFTLLRLWDRRQRNRVTSQVYKEVGNPREALERSSEAFYASLLPEEQIAAKRILLRMVQPGDGHEVTSNRIPLAEVYGAEAKDRVDRVLHRLIFEAHLVKLTGVDLASAERIELSFLVAKARADESGGQIPQLEVAHEALVRNWPRLVDWVEDERKELRQRLRLRQAAQEWERLAKSPDMLLRGSVLEEARRYDDLNEVEQRFVDAGVARLETERTAEITRQAQLLQAQAKAALEAEQSRKKTKTIRRLVALVILLLLIPLILGFRNLQRSLSHWQPISESFPKDDVAMVAYAPTGDPQAPYFYCVGTLDVGVGCSADGLSWNIYQQGLPTGESVPGRVGVYSGNVRGVDALAIDPTDVSHILAFVWDGYIYRSLNSGLRWDRTALQLAEYVRVLAMDVRGSTAFVVTSDHDLYATRDGGDTWILVSDAAGAQFDKVYDVLISPDGQFIYVGSETGLHRSPFASPWHWDRVVDVSSVRHVTNARLANTLLLLTFDTKQKGGELYRWQSSQVLGAPLTKIDREPLALTADPDPAGDYIAYVLLDNGEVLAVDNNGQKISLGSRPTWPMLDSTYHLLAVPMPSGKGVWLWMGHSDGFLRYRP